MSDPYSRADARMDGRGKTGSGGGQGFIELPKPSQIGQTTTRELRIVQRLRCDTDGMPVQPLVAEEEFWVVVDTHGCPGSMLGVDKRWVSFNCPDTALHDAQDWRTRMTCPLCILQNELWLAKNPAFKKITDMLRWRTRVYANVIDMGDVQSHWSEVNGIWQVKPKIWGFSKSTFRTLLGYCRNLGPIEDWANGRSIIVEIKRTGSNDIDIDYQFTPCDPTRVADELMPVVMSSTDLSALTTSTPLEELQAAAAQLDPRGAVGRSASGPPVGHQPNPHHHGGQAMPPTQGYSPPPPTAGAPMGATGPVYQYTGIGGQFEGASAQDVARVIMAQPAGPHHVWLPGWPAWSEATGVSEIQQALQAMQPPMQQQASVGPPQMAPPGMPGSMPAPNPPMQGGSAGYMPQGGYPGSTVGGPPNTPGRGGPPVGAPNPTPTQAAPPGAQPPGPPQRQASPAGGQQPPGPPQPPGGSRF